MELEASAGAIPDKSTREHQGQWEAQEDVLQPWITPGAADSTVCRETGKCSWKQENEAVSSCSAEQKL